MATQPLSALLASALLASTSFAVGCAEPVLDTDLETALPAEGYQFTTILASITVSEYEERFGLAVLMDTNFAASSVRLFGTGRDYEKETYVDIDEEGVLEVLIFQPIEGATENGRPVYTLEERARFPGIACEIELIGEARETRAPEDPDYEKPAYSFFGTTYLDCPGANLTLDTPKLYYEPGELIADTSVAILAQKIEEDE